MTVSLSLICGLLAVVAQQPAQTNSEESVGQGVIHLFNGKDLSGWYTFLKGRGRDKDPLGVFTVQDAAIRVSGEEMGCITTVSEFENYRLVIEFKWGGKTCAPRVDNARDSGVLLHSIGPDGAYGGMWMRSIECQLIEGGTGDFIVVGDGTDAFSITTTAAPELDAGCPVYQPGGRTVTVNSGRINWFGRDPDWKDVKGFRGKRDAEKAVGEWNLYELEAAGDQVTVKLNGVVVNKCTAVRPCKGRIQIQSEGAEILFRRIDLIPFK